MPFGNIRVYGIIIQQSIGIPKLSVMSKTNAQPNAIIVVFKYKAGINLFISG